MFTKKKRKKRKNRKSEEDLRCADRVRKKSSRPFFFSLTAVPREKDPLPAPQRGEKRVYIPSSSSSSKRKRETASSRWVPRDPRQSSLHMKR